VAPEHWTPHVPLLQMAVPLAGTGQAWQLAPQCKASSFFLQVLSAHEW
jgi:hypothetical protein